MGFLVRSGERQSMYVGELERRAHRVDVEGELAGGEARLYTPSPPAA
jgi:hypothetical protein